MKLLSWSSLVAAALLLQLLAAGGLGGASAAGVGAVCGGHSARGGSGGPGVAAAAVERVYVVQSNHLDVAFDGIAPTVGFAINVVNRYFSVYFPRAARVGAELLQRGGAAQLRWMTQPWLVELYLNCDAYKPMFPTPEGPKMPPGNTTWEPLYCPSPAEVATFKAAVKNGTITWHAFPFDAEVELGDRSLVTAGITLAQRLDRALRTGQRPIVTMSQRDVPGLTRAVVPVLRAAGVRALSVGVNGGSAPPAVPRVFRWEDSASNTSIITLYHPFGYGGESRKDAAFTPDGTAALIPAWRGDNAGPPESVDEVISLWARLMSEFPGAAIISSDFDAFVEQELEPQAARLPVVTDEIGDTWVYGAASDPWKTAAMRAAMRVRSACVEHDQPKGCSAGWVSGSCAVCRHFDFLLVKTIEHSWGLDVKTFLHDWTNYANADFDKVRGDFNYRLMEASWVEQRRYLTNAQAVLEKAAHPLAGPLREALDAVAAPTAPPNPVAGLGLKPVPSGDWGRPWTCAAAAAAAAAGPLLEVGLDASTGAMATLSVASVPFASSARPQGGFVYSTFDRDDYQRFLEGYISCDAPGFEHWLCELAHALDFAKPGVEDAQPVSRTWLPTLRGFWRSSSGCKWVVELAMPAESVAQYGAPRSLWLSFDAAKKEAAASASASASLSVELLYFNKTATRLPEAGWLLFSTPPTASDQNNNAELAATTAATKKATPTWSVTKLAKAVNPAYVVLNGSNHIHGVEQVSCTQKQQQQQQKTLRLVTTDAAIVSLGAPNPFPTPFAAPDVQGGVYSNLFNNIWGTNYIMWTQDSSAIFTWSLDLSVV